ncbi:glycosyltransferase [Acuticoccus sp.]|uniref:glycosyltransferase n=1 Tax=Acuticoccus sp. TaxID=1904378 RepID=UPI003B516829
MLQSRTIVGLRRLASHPRSIAWHLAWFARRKSYMAVRADILRHFDDDYYLTTYPELRPMVFGPVRHYILRGWKEGRDPCELFSTRDYIDMYGDVADAKVNPFQHYIVHGRNEGRTATISRARRAAQERPDDALVVPETPPLEAWLGLTKRVVDPLTAPAVNVVVPVYKSLPHVAATLWSVLSARCDTPFECLVVDDDSPEPAVSAFLQTLSEAGLLRLVVNERNIGFVRSVNLGMAANTHRDVVLLNADTTVHDGWLDRLFAPMRDDPSIATVTPLSNNATIASYPNTAVDNAYELEVPSATLDRLAAEANGGTVVDVPTGIGFCMAIRRTALDELGDFDADTFGLGYGEECDFCMRATKAGWRNVIASGVYVRHYGSASFGATQSRRSERAQELLARKHPEYAGRVARHRTADPLLASRILLDVARLREAVGPVSVVFFTHTRGGGIDTYLRNSQIALVAEGLKDVADRAIVIQTQVEGFVRIAPFGERALPYLPNLEALNIERHNSLLDRIFAILDPELIHMNSFAGLSTSSIEQLMDALRRSGRPYWHVWHDHQPLCPRLTFLDAEERYCGETDAARCVPCLASTKANFEWVRIDEWRQRFRTYLAGAEVVSAPSEAAALRARRLVDVAKVKVHPHTEPDVEDILPLSARRTARAKRRILVLGAIGPHKGAYLLQAMLRDIAERDLPLHFDVVGYTALREIEASRNVTAHGRYAGDADAVRRIRAIAPDLALFASIWPETYVFTVSVAMALELPSVAFDLGAQGERLRTYERGTVLDPRLMEDPVGLNDALLALDLDALWARPVAPRAANRSALVERFRSRSASPPREGLARGRPRTAVAADRGSAARSARPTARPSDEDQPAPAGSTA